MAWFKWRKRERKMPASCQYWHRLAALECENWGTIKTFGIYRHMVQCDKAPFFWWSPVGWAGKELR